MRLSLENATNLALLVTCLLVSALALRSLTADSADGPETGYRPGDRLKTIEGFDPGLTEETFLIVAKSTCRY